MYIPPLHSEKDLAIQHELIRQNSLGQLITYTKSAGLLASPLPFLLQTEGAPGIGEYGRLRAHLAKGNTQIKALKEIAEAGEECMIIFQGPNIYVTPTWYPSKKVHHKQVPTWDYAAVHVWGKPRIIQEVGSIRKAVSDLSDHQEKLNQPEDQLWELAEADKDYVNFQLQRILGLEIDITRIQGKWKFNQESKPGDQKGVIDGLRERETTDADIVADIVEEKYKVRTDLS